MLGGDRDTSRVVARALPGISDPPARQLWEKELGETGPAFHAFATFRDLGFARSLMKTAQVLHEEGTRKGKVETLRTQLGAWSSRWRWVSRADAYDAHIDARNRSRLEARRDEILERVGHGGQLLSYTALRALAGDAKEGIAPLDPRSLGPSDIVRFVRAAAQLELQSLGQVTDLRGAFLIAPATVTRIVGAIADVALDFIPEERHEAFLRAAAVAATGSELA